MQFGKALFNLAFCSVTIFSGCVPVSTGGAGTTSGGEPIAGTITSDSLRGENNVKIISPAGWTCESDFGVSETQGTMVRTVPLECTNGARGTLVLTGNQFQQQIVGSFKLTNGESGQVRFGYL